MVENNCTICDRFGHIEDPQHGHLTYCSCTKGTKSREELQKAFSQFKKNKFHKKSKGN